MHRTARRCCGRCAGCSGVRGPARGSRGRCASWCSARRRSIRRSARRGWRRRPRRWDNAGGRGGAAVDRSRDGAAGGAAVGSAGGGRVGGVRQPRAHPALRAARTRPAPASVGPGERAGSHGGTLRADRADQVRGRCDAAGCHRPACAVPFDDGLRPGARGAGAACSRTTSASSSIFTAGWEASERT